MYFEQFKKLTNLAELKRFIECIHKHAAMSESDCKLMPFVTFHDSKNKEISVLFGSDVISISLHEPNRRYVRLSLRKIINGHFAVERSFRHTQFSAHGYAELVVSLARIAKWHLPKLTEGYLM